MKTLEELKLELAEISTKRQLLADEIEKAELEEAAKLGSKLEEKFNEAREEFDAKIKIHLDLAAAELQKAKDLSELEGIPFESTVVDVSGYNIRRYTSDIYIPDSFKDKWGEMGLVKEYGLWEFIDQEFGLSMVNEVGWGFAWAPSSMRC